MKKSWLLIIPALLLVGAGCAGGTVTPPSATTPEAKGRAIITITDEASTLTGVTAVMITVNKVEVHGAADGWVTLSSVPRQYDLLKLKRTSASEILATMNLNAGTYDQIRLEIGRVTITKDGNTQDAKLPSNTFKIFGNLTIVAGQTSTASLDFMVDKSLHVTGNGSYILSPVVKLLTKKNVEVEVKEDGTVEEKGGELETEEQSGMDEKGEVKKDFELSDKLEVDDKGVIKRTNN